MDDDGDKILIIQEQQLIILCKEQRKITCGTAKHIAIIQIPNINLTALDNFDHVCDKKG